MEQKFRDTLRAANASVTKPRQIIFEYLQGKEPLTMQQLEKALSGQFDRASLYRTISLFEHLGITRRLQMGWKYKIELSGRFAHHHHHLTCLECGKIIPVENDNGLERQLSIILRTYRFTESSHELEVRGYCESCTKNDPRLLPRVFGSLTLPHAS